MRKFYITGLLFTIYFFAKAEGSKEFNASTNVSAYRTFLSYTTPVACSNLGWYPITTLDSVESRSYFYVYANLTDSICVASSALAVGLGAIKVYKPDGTLLFTYTTAPADTGLIRAGAGSKLRENQGPFGLYAGGVGGYIPRVIVADQAGIWRVEFISPNPGTAASNYFNNPTLVPKTTADFNQMTNNCIISAFDVSIVKNNSIVPGRVYTDYMSLSGGDLRRTTGGTQYFFTEYYTLYALTKQGYRYDLSLNGIAPYGYFIYADNVGLQLADGITPAYESVSFQPTRPANRRILRPGDPDTYSESKHKMFFNTPDAAMPVSAMLNNQTVWLNPPLVNGTGLLMLRYTITGVPNPLSGYFTFDYPNLGIRYKIIIDCNGDFIYGNGNDVTLAGTSVVNVNNINWDGRDATGAVMPLSSCIGARIEFAAGEVHVPLADAENFRGGIEIKRLNGNGTLPNYTVHWNDSVLNDNNNINGSYMKKTPTAGVSSLGGIHNWERQENPNPPTQGYSGNPTHTTYYGDTRYMDIWAYDTLQTGNFPAVICYVLPLKLIAFNGVHSSTANHLTWQVSGDWQGAKFIAEKLTINGFESIGMVNATAAAQYNFTDNEAVKGKQVYRIKLQQRDGKVAYSNQLALGGTTSQISVFPNPSKGSFTIKAPGGIRSITLTDMQGKVVQELPVVNKDNITVTTPLLLPGTYLLKIVNAKKEIINQKITIQ
jgi:Secretion system C-terminal sorting domain